MWHAKIPSVAFRYQSGDEILAGDQILYASEQGVIEFVADPENPDHTWYIEQFGGGCMLRVAPFGSLFLSDPHEEEDLECASRGESKALQ